MKNEFVPYELALKLKQLGFDEPCFLYWWKNESGYILADIIYDEVRTLDFKAPLFQQAFRWFREKYHIIGEPKYKGGLTTKTSWYDYIIYSNIDWEEDSKQYKTYEESELACLKKLIEIVTKQQEQ
jgi:hypothetical protein